MQLLHRLLGTWRRAVDAFFTTTAFARSRFINAGFPADRVHVKYNSVAPDPGVGMGDGGYVIFVGRLSPEKGLATLLEAWRHDSTLPPLKIAGDGPLASTVAAAAAADSRIESLGCVPETEVFRLVGSASALIVPSTWYEGFPKQSLSPMRKELRLLLRGSVLWPRLFTTAYPAIAARRAVLKTSPRPCIARSATRTDSRRGVRPPANCSKHNTLPRRTTPV